MMLQESAGVGGEHFAGATLPTKDQGDVTLVLDDGTELAAHSHILQQASSVFTNAMACRSTSFDQQAANPASLSGMPANPGARMRLPLSATTKAQALLLLQCLYQWARESWLSSSKATELVDLARVLDRFAVDPVLRLVDKSLVERCGTRSAAEPGYLTVGSAPMLFKLAQQLHLSRFEVHVAHFLGKNARAVQLSGLDDTIAAVLHGARQLS